VAEDRIGAAQIFTLGPDLNVRAAMSIEDGAHENGVWRLRGVKRTEFSADGARVVELPELEWSGTLAPEVLRLLVLEADELALARKAVAPLTVMAMMLFAVPFVLGPLRNSGAGQRLLVGVLIGLAFYVINEVTANVGQLYGWNVLVSAGAPTLAFALIGLWRLTDSR
jgi:lipopolysaccharide export system permease protein